jgi:hypothetical protein
MIAQDDNGMEGLKDKNGWVVEPKYISVRDFSEGLAAVAISHDTEADLLKQQGLNEKEIKTALLEKGIHKTLIYNMIDKARDKKYPDLWGFIDIYGNIMIHPQYKSVGRFKSGLALVEKYGKTWEKNLYHYIDKMGNKAIALEWDDFESADEFQDDGTAIIKRKCGMGVIDTKGNVVIPFEFAELSYAIDGYRPARPLDKELSQFWGIINEQGNWIVEPKFNDMQLTTDGHLLVNYADEEIQGNGIVNILGEWIVSPQALDIITSDCDMLICSEREVGEFQVPLTALYNYGRVKLLGEKTYQGIEVVNKDVIKCMRYTVEQGEKGARYQFVRPDGKVLIDGLCERKVAFLGNLVANKIGRLDGKKIEYNYTDSYGIDGKLELKENKKLGELIDHTGIEYFKVTKPIKLDKKETISIYDGNTCIMNISNGDYYILIDFNGEQYLSQKPQNFDSFEFFKTAFQD